jgi:DNA-binding XRE family transcriptional regulator
LQSGSKGKSQQETAAMVGVTHQTIDNWEKENTNNCNFTNTCNPTPDLRISIPKQEYERI